MHISAMTFQSQVQATHPSALTFTTQTETLATQFRTEADIMSRALTVVKDMVAAQLGDMMAPPQPNVIL